MGLLFIPATRTRGEAAEVRVAYFYMLDKDDVRVLEKMFEGLRNEMRQEFKSVRSEMAQGFKTVRDDIIDLIDQNIQPQLTSLTARITRLERRVVA